MSKTLTSEKKGAAPEKKIAAPTLPIPNNGKSKVASSTDSKLPVFCKARKAHNCCIDTPWHSSLGRKSLSLVDLTPKTQRTTAKSRKIKAHNCCIDTPSSELKPYSSLGRKSLSLVDLTPKTQRTTAMSRKITTLDTNMQMESKLQVSFLTHKESELARTVCKMFILNAWRRRITQTTSLQTQLTIMVKEVENLKLQRIVLNELLKSEHDRATSSMGEAACLNTCLENCRKENALLQNENNYLKTEKKLLQNVETEMISEMKIMKDELILTYEQNKYLRRDSDDLAKTVSECKQENMELQNRLSKVSVLLREKEISSNEMEIANSNLLSRVSELENTNEKLLEENKNKEMMIEEHEKTEKNLKGKLIVFQTIYSNQNETISNLKSNLSELENRLKKQTKYFENLRYMVVKSAVEREECVKNCTQQRNIEIFEAIKKSSVYLSFNNPNPDIQINPLFL